MYHLFSCCPLLSFILMSLWSYSPITLSSEFNPQSQELLNWFCLWSWCDGGDGDEWPSIVKLSHCSHANESFFCFLLYWNKSGGQRRSLDYWGSCSTWNTHIQDCLSIRTVSVSAHWILSENKFPLMLNCWFSALKVFTHVQWTVQDFYTNF